MPSWSTGITLERCAASVPLARARVTAALRRWGGDAETVDNVALLVTELVDNAVRHSQGSHIAVHLTCRDDRVRCNVLDGSPALPAAHVPSGTPSGPEAGVPPDVGSELSESGRGLCLVNAIASRWGSAPDNRTGWSRKAVWFELDNALPRADLPRRGRSLLPSEFSGQQAVPVDPALLMRVLIALRDR